MVGTVCTAVYYENILEKTRIENYQIGYRHGQLLRGIQYMSLEDLQDSTMYNACYKLCRERSCRK